MAISVNKARQYMEIIPVLLFLVNLAAYILYITSTQINLSSNINYVFWSFQHCFDASLITLLCLGYLSIRDRWHFVSKVCIVSVLALWVNNIPYVVFKYEVGIYFLTFATAIYITTIVLALWILTRR